jgi:2-polyprenyl-3-methyl-5-hydroxy-6-metoxy-1,4-benzoquinol methylase
MSEETRELGDASQLYLSYDTWKTAGEPFQCSRELAASFAGELKSIPLRGAQLFEIGYGAGSFMAWARAKGAIVAGSERVPTWLEAAAREGIETLPAEFELVADQHSNRFDLIVAFDVFEHFSWGEIALRLAAGAKMIKPGGRIMLRFPNSQSPFGLSPQNGDATHITALSRGKIEQAIQGLPLAVERYGAAYRPLGPNPLKVPVRLVRYALRDLIGIVVKFASADDFPIDAVVTIVLRKSLA